MIGAQALAQLVASLLVTIAGYTGYAIPGDPPTVRFVTHAALEQRACQHPCPVLAFTTTSGEILLDMRLNVGVDAAATSILVHELTHFLQQAGAASRAPITCATWMAREREAYDVQYRWLRATAPNVRNLSESLTKLGPHPALPPCRGGGASD